jgi:acyl carrier protein
MNEQIKELMANIFEVEISDIGDDASPESIESWDSLKHMNLIVALEEEFNVQFTDEEMLQMLNFQLISLILKEKLEA